MATCLSDAQLKTLGVERTARLDPAIMTEKRRAYLRARLGWEEYTIKAHLAKEAKREAKNKREPDAFERAFRPDKRA